MTSIKSHLWLWLEKIRAKSENIRVLKAPSCRQMGVIFFPAVIGCAFGEPGAPTSSELQLLYLIASVGQSISIPASNFMQNFFIVMKVAPVTLCRVSLPACNRVLDSVSSSLGCIVHCRALLQMSLMSFKAFRFNHEEPYSH